jgi:hypothetical protein
LAYYAPRQVAPHRLSRKTAATKGSNNVALERKGTVVHGVQSNCSLQRAIVDMRLMMTTKCSTVSHSTLAERNECPDRRMVVVDFDGSLQ